MGITGPKAASLRLVFPKHFVGVAKQTRLARLVASEYEPSGFIVNPADWYSDKLLLKKDTQGHLFGDPVGAVTGPGLWGIPVVVTKLDTCWQLLGA